jgi:alkylated DNA nucleotide flippase Atl1
MFQNSAGKHERRNMTAEGRPLPRISDLVMAHVPGLASEKLAWLRMQKAAGRLDGDDPEEVAQADALLAMLVRIAGSKDEKRAATSG